MEPRIAHLHTYFFFPFAINNELLPTPDGDVPEEHHWLDQFERWMGCCHSEHSPEVKSVLGGWRRAPYDRFDMESSAYADMVFFHPFVRHVFFDTVGVDKLGSDLSLIRCYSIGLAGKKLTMEATNERGEPHAVEITDLRLFVFANQIGILSIGVEADNLSAQDALWINEMFRKVYPSSARARREGRAPSAVHLYVEEDGVRTLVARELFENCKMIGFEPPLSKLIRRFLYFLDYYKHQYEQILDDRMIVYTYAEIDADSVPADYATSEQYRVLVSRFLYVDRATDLTRYRYSSKFLTDYMDDMLYSRWAHEGTIYGCTAYSNLSITIGRSDRGEHMVKEGFLIERMFATRYYLMALIALFYRATLLMFNEKTALVSKMLYQDQQHHQYKAKHIDAALHLRAEYLHFTNYWYFEELANKDEESEHFDLQVRHYRLDEMKAEVQGELESMSTSVQEYFQNRNTTAVNRLGLLSLIFGAGAVVTGFFGMNFARFFGKIFFEPEDHLSWIHYSSIAFVTFFTLAALAFGFFIIARSWRDYAYVFSAKQPHEPPRYER